MQSEPSSTSAGDSWRERPWATLWPIFPCSIVGYLLGAALLGPNPRGYTSFIILLGLGLLFAADLLLLLGTVVLFGPRRPARQAHHAGIVVAAAPDAAHSAPRVDRSPGPARWIAATLVHVPRRLRVGLLLGLGIGYAGWWVWSLWVELGGIEPWAAYHQPIVEAAFQEIPPPTDAELLHFTASHNEGGAFVEAKYVTTASWDAMRADYESALIGHGWRLVSPWRIGAADDPRSMLGATYCRQDLVANLSYNAEPPPDYGNLRFSMFWSQGLIDTSCDDSIRQFAHGSGA